MDQNRNQYEKAVQVHFIGQWITSLAISVICCAILFVVFAGYMVGLYEKTNLLEARADIMRENYSNLSSEIMFMRRLPIRSTTRAPAPAVVLEEEISGEVDIETPVVAAPEPQVAPMPEPQVVKTPPVAAKVPTPAVEVPAAPLAAPAAQTAVEKLAPDARVPASNP